MEGFMERAILGSTLGAILVAILVATFGKILVLGSDFGTW
jgi:uncharacterized membrane protein